jgi:hypothetical protein
MKDALLGNTNDGLLSMEYIKLITKEFIYNAKLKGNQPQIISLIQAIKHRIANVMLFNKNVDLDLF